MSAATYQSFLESKAQLATTAGFLDVTADDVNVALKPHQRDAVLWAVRGGRRAVFASFGLGKTVMQLETVRLVRDRCGADARGLIVAPLGVRQEFVHDAVDLLETKRPRFIRSNTEATEPGIYLTNYETVREGKLDPRGFDVVSLDEAAVLRGFGGTKTFRQLMRLYEGSSAYRFVATATPSPNEYIELLAYAAFLDILDVGQAKTRFFKRDSEHADRLTLLPHMEESFWHWVASWALFIQKPSDLGYSDEGYELPPIEVRWHEVPSAPRATAEFDQDGRGALFREASMGVVAASRERRESIDVRVAKMRELVDEAPAEDHFLLWHDLEDERRAIADQLPLATWGDWHEYRDGHPRALELYERHYSAYQYADGRERKPFIGPGEKTVLLTAAGDALFGWRKFKDDSGQTGVCCSVFRNEGPLLSSDLIREAMGIAWTRWPGERLYTYVDAAKVESPNPGYCFLQAGWSRAGLTKGGLVILEALPGVDVPVVQRTAGLTSVWGSQDLDTREQSIIDFSEGRIRYLSTKPVIAGSGCNFQRHCHRAIFTGIGYKFSDLIQAVHRIQRFQQPHPVRIDFIYTTAEAEIRRKLEAKWRRHDELVARMTAIIREHGLAHRSLDGIRRWINIERQEHRGDGYVLVNNDTVPETASMASDSVDLIVTSLPFSTQYEYSPSFNDFGHNEDNAAFWRQMDYLTPELLRVLKPGRVAAIHVKDRVVPGGMTGLGFQTIYRFSDAAADHFESHGLAFMARRTIVTDVVREKNQTYRLGWTEQCKDGTKMGAGLPEYLLLFRKPPSDASNGYADEPVVKDKAEYSRSRWQVDAHGMWRSDGNRHLTPDEFAGLTHAQMFRLFRDHNLTNVYDYEAHVAVGESLEAKRLLPTTFMLLQPPSWHPDVWTDVARMRTLNMLQQRKGLQQHLCPLQFDIVDRVVTEYSARGELVFDPFGGIMTVPYCALKLGRQARAHELNTDYWRDGVYHVEAVARGTSAPTLFDLASVEASA